MNGVESYFEGVRGKRIAFLGAGLSHRELISMYAGAGAEVTLCDRRDRAALGEYAETAERQGAALCLGEGYLGGLERYDIVFRTPGIDYTKPEIQAAVAAGVEVTSEIETFFKLCPAHTIGVTGSDGKTTTTTLIARVLEAAGKTVHLGGNIGRPLLPIIGQVKPDDWAVVELSSFQLISMPYSPDIAVVTNLAPNHLDHHKDMREYVDAKRNILLHQSEDGRAVLNLENAITEGMKSDVRGKLCWFSSRRPVESGAYIDGDMLIFAYGGERREVLDLTQLRLPGAHNRENVAAAAAAAVPIVGDRVFREAALSFTGVEHRIELTRELDGVRWYNDSIGTSPTRTIAGLRSFPEKVILIAGGYDKKISYAPLAPEIKEHVKLLLLCGDTADKIEGELKKIGAEVETERLDDLEHCVARARERARAGDVVLMSPASASFDRYKNFEERGKHFKRLVGELK